MSGVLVITGPTATGKSDLAVMLAKLHNGEIVSADSMQIYRGMSIGTAAPTQEEQQGIAHHLVGTFDPNRSYSVSEYVEEASRCVDDIQSRGRLPIIVGGTGLYIDSLLSGRSFMGGDEKLKARFEMLYDDRGGEAMLKLLAGVDEYSAKKLHANDKKRIVRALEVFCVTGKTITDHNEQSRSLPPRYKYCKLALNFTDRSLLYRRIDERVDKMLALGLVGEVQRLLDSGVPIRSTAMQAIGYKEIARALRGECSMEQAVEDVKRETRRYAKRQLSWLNAQGDVNWIMWDKKQDYPEACQISTQTMEITGII